MWPKLCNVYFGWGFNFYNNWYKTLCPNYYSISKGNAKLSKLLSEWLKRPVYWNEYSVIVEKSYNANTLIKNQLILVVKELIDSYEGGNNTVTADSHRRYSYPRVEIKNYNTKIDGRNFYGQPINNQETNDLIKQYNELRKISTGQGDDYTTGCLLNFTYFKKNNKIISADLSKQKALDADLRVIQQIISTGKVDEAAVVYYLYEKSRETTLQFPKGTTKLL